MNQINAGYAETPDCRPPSQVETNQQFIDDSIKRLQETVRHVISRLNPLLTPSAPAQCGNGANKISEILAPIAQRSSEQARAIQAEVDALTDILQRLAV